MNPQSLISFAQSYAQKSKMPWQIAAFVVKHGNIVSVGINRYSKGSFPKSIHAERSAIEHSKNDVNNAVIWVYRFKKNGDLAIAKPCISCNNFMASAGIKSVVYSTNLGTLEKQSV